MSTAVCMQITRFNFNFKRKLRIFFLLQKCKKILSKYEEYNIDLINEDVIQKIFLCFTRMAFLQVTLTTDY